MTDPLDQARKFADLAAEGYATGGYLEAAAVAAAVSSAFSALAQAELAAARAAASRGGDEDCPQAGSHQLMVQDRVRCSLCGFNGGS
jgi:hypothetical protein